MGQTLYQLDGANDAHPLGLHLLTLHLLHTTDTMPFGHSNLSNLATDNCVRRLATFVLDSALFEMEATAFRGYSCGFGRPGRVQYIVHNAVRGQYRQLHANG